MSEYKNVGTPGHVDYTCQVTVAEKFVSSLVSQQKQIEPEFSKVIDDKFYNLLWRGKVSAVCREEDGYESKQ